MITNLKQELDSQFNTGQPAKRSAKSSHFSDLINQMDSKSSINLPFINQTEQKQHISYKTDKMEALYSSEPSIMFTRLDAERNTKRLRRAITRGFLTDQIYEVFINKFEYFVI